MLLKEYENIKDKLSKKFYLNADLKFLTIF